MPSSSRSVTLYDISPEELVDLVVHRLEPILLAHGPTGQETELLGPKEVEKLLDISHQTRIEWTRQGILRAYSFGGRKTFYKRHEIIAALIPMEH